MQIETGIQHALRILDEAGINAIRLYEALNGTLPKDIILDYPQEGNWTVQAYLPGPGIPRLNVSMSTLTMNDRRQMNWIDVEFAIRANGELFYSKKLGYSYFQLPHFDSYEKVRNELIRLAALSKGNLIESDKPNNYNSDFPSLTKLSSPLPDEDFQAHRDQYESDLDSGLNEDELYKPVEILDDIDEEQLVNYSYIDLEERAINQSKQAQCRNWKASTAHQNRNIVRNCSSPIKTK